MEKPAELKDGVYWVGALDWNVREFHGYTTSRGSTYNAYLVRGEKTALVDTVKAGFFPEMLSRIESIMDPADIDYLIVNHVEMDHSGAVPLFAERFPHVQLVATDNGIKALQRHYRKEWSIQKVKTGDEIALGRKTLQFLEAYMLHWPDSMFTYLKEDCILLPNDGFGQHFASYHRFDDENTLETVMDEAAKYFGNILMPLAPLIPPLLKKVKKMGIPIEMIAPSHGVIWRSHPDKIIQAYSDWSAGVAEDRVLIIYDTMWQSTATMARAIAQGISNAGVENKLIHVRRNHRSDIMKEILSAKVLVFGSPTINEGIFPTVAELLIYLKGLRPLKKKGLAFGSYGWGGEAIPAINDALKGMGIEVIDPGLSVMYVPGDEDLENCVKLGEKIAASL
ncbi:MAG: FprA family A-type flavoprotein [Desulfobacterales bacterium]|nr:MAG: FprA family A-type flavoprotein [Desulfobacterales bacterium]